MTAGWSNGVESEIKITSRIMSQSGGALEQGGAARAGARDEPVFVNGGCRVAWCAFRETGFVFGGV